MLDSSYQLGLTDLLDQNITCYEYFHGLPQAYQRMITERDIGSYDDMQAYVDELNAHYRTLPTYHEKRIIQFD